MVKKYKADPNIKLRVIAGEAVLIPVGAKTREFNGMATVSPSAKYLWEALSEGGKSRRDLANLLLVRYDCTETEAQADVDEFVELLLHKGLLIEEE